MSILHLKHIEKHLGDQFRDLIDLQDCVGRSDSQRRSLFLSRALAAYAIRILSEATEQEASESVVDGFGDNGIDAVFIDRSSTTLHILQAKWQDQGKGTIDRGSIQKFLKGVKDLLQCRYDRFNNKVSARSEGIDQLLNTVGCRVVLSVVHCGAQEMASLIWQDVNDVLVELNDPTEIVRFEELNQRRIYEALTSALDGSPVALDVTLQDWGRLEEPFRAYYGLIGSEQIAAWWDNHRERLLAKNIRRFLPNTTINKAIISSLTDEPQNFWYLNNGITLLCERVDRKVLGATDRSVGYFYCQGASIVNGAQTVGAIGRTASAHKSQLVKAKVLARIISLEDCPKDFGRRVTIATNTQNRIHNRDFAALDPEQERLSRELRFEDVDYVYKTGVAFPDPTRGCTIEDATIALACASDDPRLAVMAKAQLGSLWEDIGKHPYLTLFNGALTGPQIWNAVRILYIVEHSLTVMLKKKNALCGPYLVHANRFILRQVFRLLGRSKKSWEDWDITHLVGAIATRLAVELESRDNIYPAWVFKNAKQCIELETAIPFEELMLKKWEGEQGRQFLEAARSRPTHKVQMSLFEEDDEVLM